jgi:hypothetical protein
MVNNSINIIKTKESLNIKTKERLNSSGQQFHQYHQNKRKFKHHVLMFKLSFVLMILMELLTTTVKTFFCFDV